MAMECGGGTEIVHDPDTMVTDAEESLSPLMRAADMIVRFFCVGEALSIPLIRGTWKAARHPLPRAVLGRIVRDEAAHGTFGFVFLDWALPRLGADDRAYLGRGADRTIAQVHALWDRVRANPPPPASTGDALAWMKGDDYLALAERSMKEKVTAPLRDRGIPLAPASLSGA